MSKANDVGRLVSGSHQLDYEDGRTMALMIANIYACGWLDACSIGTTWRPRGANGRQWSERKCCDVLRTLVMFGYVSMHESITGGVARVNEAGFRYFDLAGKPGITDADAERYFLAGHVSR